MYQAFQVPLDIAYRPDVFNGPQFRTLNSLIDLVFILDICICFRTTYIDPISGEEITDSRAIARKYAKSTQFIIDILSSVPFFDLFGGGIIVQMFGTLKILRIKRISQVILNLNNSQELKALLKVINLVFYMIIYIHLMGCIWFFFVDENE